MKTLIAIGLFLLSAPLLVAAESDPFAEAASETKRPERPIFKLPKSVTHKEINGSTHQYTISGVYRGSAAKSKDTEEAVSTYKMLIPNALDLGFDFKAAKATFSTTRELSLSELAYAIDDMAELGGDIPYWVELEARDLERTKQFTRVRYTIEATDAITPPDLAWFWLPRDREFRLPLNIGGSELGSLLIVPSTAFCMSHSRFSLRILDPEGKVIWEEEETAYAGVRIALANDNELFGTHKIWLTRDDHGKSAKFLIREHFVEEKEIEQGGAGQPATRSESKSEGGDKPQPEAEGRSR